MYVIVTFYFPCVLRFSFSSFFNVFLVCFLVFFCFYTPPPNQEKNDSK